MALPVYSDVEVKGKVVVEGKVTAKQTLSFVEADGYGPLTVEYDIISNKGEVRAPKGSFNNLSIRDEENNEKIQSFIDNNEPTTVFINNDNETTKTNKITSQEIVLTNNTNTNTITPQKIVLTDNSENTRDTSIESNGISTESISTDVVSSKVCTVTDDYCFKQASNSLFNYISFKEVGAIPDDQYYITGYSSGVIDGKITLNSQYNFNTICKLDFTNMNIESKDYYIYDIMLGSSTAVFGLCIDNYSSNLQKTSIFSKNISGTIHVTNSNKGSIYLVLFHENPQPNS